MPAPGTLRIAVIPKGTTHDYWKSVHAGALKAQSDLKAKGVTIVDDGAIDKRRGSLTIDDEGTPSQCTTLIEDGILVIKVVEGKLGSVSIKGNKYFSTVLLKRKLSGRWPIFPGIISIQ